MSQKSMVQFGGQNVVADDSASASTIALRDASGNLVAATMQGSTLKSTGGLILPATAKTADFTADAATTFYEVDATSGAVAGTLPPASSVPSQVYVFKKVDNSHNFVLHGDGSETIDGSNTQTISSQYGVLRVRSNGTVWYLF